MNDRPKSKALEEARSLESQGQLKSAATLYLRAGAVHEAARLLSGAGKHADAGNLILNQSKIDIKKIEGLNSSGKKLAYLAATYLVKGGQAQKAVDIFVGLGDRRKAAQVLEQQGDLLGAQRLREGHTAVKQPAHPAANRMQAYAVGGIAVSKQQAQQMEQDGKHDLAIQAYVQLKQYGEAARILKTIGRTGEAANLFAEGGMPYEAAMCYLELGDTGKGLDNLIRVPRGERKKYRFAAVQSIRVASELNVLSFQLEHFLTEFVSSGPTEQREFEAFYQLSKLYEQHDLLENAREVLSKILIYDPEYRDAAERLDELTQQSKSTPAVYERIRKQEASFRGERKVGAPSAKPKSIIGLPPLPDIPDLPPAPKITGLNLTPNAPGSSAQVPNGQNISSPASRGATMGIANPPQEQPPRNPFEVGNTIANRYLLQSKIGEGGMAIVFKANDLELDDEIALKVFLQQVVDPKMQEESLGRFKQELKLSRQLNHENIIRLYDIGMFEGRRYISMELLRGIVLEELMEKEGRVDFARGLAYLGQSCAGLQAAHDKGVIHRDIKPDNLFVTNEEVIKVMDFGIAKNTHARGMTIEGMTAGTPEYMAPEQISSFSDVNHSADLYSLGLIAYRMFTAKLPFEHEELMPLLMMHLNETPTPPRQLNPEIPAELEEIILRLLEKDPANRISSCRELASLLKQIGASFRR